MDYRTSPRKTNDSQLARLRMARGLTQKDLAEKIGCYANDVGRWERGICRPNAVSLLRLAHALGCNVEEIYGGGGDL